MNKKLNKKRNDIIKKLNLIAMKKIDNSYKIKVKKQINKVIQNPEIGKPMKANRKGTREVYVSPFRLYYAFFLSDDEEDEGKEIYKLVFLDLYHKDNQ